MYVRRTETANKRNMRGASESANSRDKDMSHWNYYYYFHSKSFSSLVLSVLLLCLLF